MLGNPSTCAPPWEAAARRTWVNHEAVQVEYALIRQILGSCKGIVAEDGYLTTSEVRGASLDGNAGKI